MAVESCFQSMTSSWKAARLKEVWSRGVFCAGVPVTASRSRCDNLCTCANPGTSLRVVAARTIKARRRSRAIARSSSAFALSAGATAAVTASFSCATPRTRSMRSWSSPSLSIEAMICIASTSLRSTSIWSAVSFPTSSPTRRVSLASFPISSPTALPAFGWPVMSVVNIVTTMPSLPPCAPAPSTLPSGSAIAIFGDGRPSLSSMLIR